MSKINIVDFWIENMQSDKGANDEISCCSVTAFYTFAQENIEEMEIDELSHFSITVGTPLGIKKYFEKLLEKADSDILFYPHVAVVEKFDKAGVLKAIKKKFEELPAMKEREIVLNAMLYFDCEYQDDEGEIKKLLYGTK